MAAIFVCSDYTRLKRVPNGIATLWIAEISSKRIIFQACPPTYPPHNFLAARVTSISSRSSFADLKAKETVLRHFSKRLNARVAWLIENQQRAYIYRGRGGEMVNMILSKSKSSPELYFLIFIILLQIYVRKSHRIICNSIKTISKKILRDIRIICSLYHYRNRQLWTTYTKAIKISHESIRDLRMDV